MGGPNIFIKRDDCTGLATGGNKTRKLEFLIPDAIKNKADVWIVVYQSSGIDVHTGVTGLASGMTKTVIAMNEIKKAGLYEKYWQCWSC